MKYIQQSKKEVRFILFLFILLGVLVVGLRIFNYYEIKTLQDISIKLYEHPFKVSNAALNIQLKLYKIHREMKDIVLSESKEELDRLIQIVDEDEKLVYENLTIIENNILGDKGLKLQQNTLELFKNWKVIRDEVISLMQNNQRAKAISITKGKGAMHVTKMDSAAHMLYEYAHNKAVEFKNSSISISQQIERQNLILDPITLLLFVLIIYYTFNRVSNYILRNTHLTQVLSVIRDVNQLIAREKEPKELIQKSCEILMINHVYENAWIALFDKNSNIDYISNIDTSQNFIEFKEKIKDGWMPYCIARSMDNNQLHSVIENKVPICTQCPLDITYKNKSAYTIALKHAERIYGYLTIAIDKKYIYDNDELALLNEVAGDIAYALYNLDNEHKLIESEKRYHELFKSSHAIELLINPENGTIIDANEKASSYYGYSYEELLSMKIQDINTLNDKEILKAMSLVKKEQRDKFLFKHKLSNGEIRDVEVYSGAFRIDEGRTILHSIIFDITEQLELRLENQRNQEQLKLIIEGSHDGIWDWNLLTNQIYFSPRYKEILGYRDDELENILETWESRLHPKDKEKTLLNVKKSHKEGNHLYKDIHRLKHKDGHWVWIEARGQTLFDDEGKPIRMLGSNTDISEQKESEEALCREKKRYETAEKIGKVGSWEYLINTQKFIASLESKRIYGFPENSDFFTIEAVEKCIPERERVHQALIDLLEHGSEYNLKFEIHPFDGSASKIISSIAEVEYDENHKPIKVSGFIQDITDKERTIRLLEHKTKELETVIQEAPNPIMLHNEKGEVLLVNKVWEDLTGYQYNEIDTIEKWTEKAYKEEKPTIKEYIDHLYTLNHKIDEGTYAVSTKDDRTIFWQFSSAPLGIIDGKRTIISTAMDVTELKEKNELMISQSRHAAMGEMIGMIAHQWRQPLTIISMSANNMILDIALDELDTQHVKEYSDEILMQSQHLSKTIDDFRNFFKPDKSLLKIRLQEVLEETYTIVKDSLTNNNITLKTSYRSESEVDAYPRELMQVFVNIINNAKDALLLKQPEEAQIEIKVFEDANYVITEICDNGGGIDEAILPKIFDPYFTTKDEKTGTGLGLYMSKMIIDDHLHGKIEAYNQNNGTCFSVRLRK